MRRMWIITCVVAAMVAVPSAAAGASARVRPAGRGGAAVAAAGMRGDGTSVFDINAQGVMVGTCYYGVAGALGRGFVLRRGVFTMLNVFGSDGVEAKGINAAGDVVGDYSDARGINHGFLLHDGRYTTLNVPGRGNQTFPYRINAGGDIVGFYSGPRNATHGFVLHDGTYTTFNDPLATGGTSGFGINNVGDIVGASFRHGHRFGFLLHDGTFTTINVPGSVSTYANDITDAGVILGGYVDAGAPMQASCSRTAGTRPSTSPTAPMEPTRTPSTPLVTSSVPTLTAPGGCTVSCCATARTPPSMPSCSGSGSLALMNDWRVGDPGRPFSRDP
jgi:uncharacterized membrane protein